MSALRYTDYGATVGAPPDEFVPYYGYNGEEHDPLTGLQYLRARYYDAASGSFTSRDPYEGAADVPLSQNGFTYAHNNPVNYADPSGMAVAGGKVKLINDGGGGSSRRAGTASAAVNAAVAAVKRAQSTAAVRRAQSTAAVRRAQSTMTGAAYAHTVAPRPGTALLPAQLEYQRAQTMMYLREGCSPSARRAVAQAVDQIRLENDFKKAMRDAYGFDSRTSGIMLDVMDAIDRAYPDATQAEKDWRYTRLIGGFSYNEGMLGMMFVFTSGWATEDRVTYEHFTEVLGISDSDYRALRYAVRLQHDSFNISSQFNITTDVIENYNTAMGTSYGLEEFKPIWEEMYNRYKGSSSGSTNGDFAHQTITQSTFLFSDSRFTILDKMREDYTGWVGDVVLGSHSMELPDVLSDLDAVNISNLMRDNGTDYLNTTVQYYDGIRDGTIDRDKMFLSYVSFVEIRQLCANLLGVPSDMYMLDSELEQKLQLNYGDVYEFYMRMKEANER